SLSVFSCLCFHCCGANRDLHSFPTRRSSDLAILLDNAFIETASQRPVEVPEHLRAKGEPGSYLVQSRHALDNAFYGSLREAGARSEEHTSELQSLAYLVCRLLLEKKKKQMMT